MNDVRSRVVRSSALFFSSLIYRRPEWPVNRSRDPQFYM